MEKTILVVDDNVHLRRILTTTLEFFGYHVLTAENGVEAVTKAISGEPELILLDLDLPDMSGMEAARLLKKDRATASIPIIGFSASFGPEWRDQAMRAGMVDCLQKPVQASVIKAKIQQVLAK